MKTVKLLNLRTFPVLHLKQRELYDRVWGRIKTVYLSASAL